MQIKLVVDISAVLYHKQTMKEFVIDNSIAKVYNEEDEEFRELCDNYENVIGFAREENKEKFDEILAEQVSMDVKAEWKERLDKITEAFKLTYVKQTKGAYVELAGYLINPEDFCAFRVDRFDIRVIKTVEKE